MVYHQEVQQSNSSQTEKYCYGKAYIPRRETVAARRPKGSNKFMKPETETIFETTAKQSAWGNRAVTLEDIVNVFHRRMNLLIQVFRQKDYYITSISCPTLGDGA